MGKYKALKSNKEVCLLSELMCYMSPIEYN